MALAPSMSLQLRSGLCACGLVLCVTGSVIAGSTPGGDRFGEAIALSGETVVVGRPFTRPGSNPPSGAAVVFVRVDGSWRLQAQLSSDLPTNDGFGAAVALSGETAAVAAPEASAPAVHVFERLGSGWLRSTRLDAPQSNTGFAQTIALDGDTLIVGAPLRNAARGAVYVFERTFDSWQLVATLTASNAGPDDRFGGSLAIEGTRAVIGASGNGAGAAYVFERGGGIWQQRQRLQSNAGDSEDRFARAVALAGDRIAIGAPGREIDDEEQGAVVIFEKNIQSWTQTAELSAFDGRENDLFGWSVSLDGNTVVAGAIFDTDTAQAQGSAYSFMHMGGVWVTGMKLRASDARDSDIFGNAVALDGNLLWIGAPGFQNNSFGTAYAFERVGPIWNAGQRFVDPNLFKDQFEGD